MEKNFVYAILRASKNVLGQPLPSTCNRQAEIVAGGRNTCNGKKIKQTGIGWRRINHDKPAEIKSSIIIYPNPSKGLIYITNYPNTENLSQVEIFNSLGQLVFNSTISKSQVSIDLSSNKPGIYLINIKTEHGYENKKIILE